jgi:hypothetical protein
MKKVLEKSATIVSDHNVIQKETNNDKEADGLESDEEYEETVTFDTEHISCAHSSIITDKYKENMDAPTVANKLADMIIDLECKENATNSEQKYSNPDPDEIFYSDDESRHEWANYFRCGLRKQICFTMDHLF